jgi:hypothetical protein
MSSSAEANATGEVARRLSPRRKAGGRFLPPSKARREVGGGGETEGVGEAVRDLQ